MDNQNQHLDTLKDIKQMMERSSRFISLSGLSGIAAGACALVGAWLANNTIEQSGIKSDYDHLSTVHESLGQKLLQIAVITFIAAFLLSFLFTYLRSRKTNTPLWGTTAKRLLINVAVPIIAGGIYLLKMVQAGIIGLIAPGCLIFYGLSLLNASKYTLKEIKYLGYCEIILGIINLWWIGKGIYFWTIGFGVLHISYGFVMWWKYERN
jgi:hypothetical protein